MAKTSSDYGPAGKGGGEVIPAPIVSPYLKWSVILMGVTLVVGLIVVFSTIIYRAVKMSRGAAEIRLEAQRPISIPIAKGARFERMVMDGGRLAVYLKSDSDQEIVIINIKTGDLVRRLKLSPQ